MQIKFKNADLQGTYDFLNHLKISGAAVNRARYQIVKLIEAKLKEFSESRKALIDMYANKGDDDKPLIKDGYYQLSADSKDDYNREYRQLLSESAMITIDDYVDKFKTLYEFLTKYNEELDGTDGYAYGAFLDELERAGVNK